ncbi:hypothetical protein Tco_0942529 [Tanacetum coccineum]
MAWFEQLETHLRDLYLNSSSHAVDAFKPVFHSFFGEEHQTFRLKMFHNLDQLMLQLERENLLEVNLRTCLDALRTLFKEFFASKRVNSSEHLNQCWQKDFKEYTLCKPDTYRRDLLKNLDTLEAVIHRAVITYGRLQLQSQDVQINLVRAVDDSLNVSKSCWIESENHNALSKSVNETQLQQHESLVTESTTLEANLNSDIKALDVGLVITESSETKSDMHDTSSSSRTYITHVVDANIRPVNDQVPSAEESPEFREFFEINDLKAQLQAKTTLICSLKNQIKSVKEESNEAKVKNDIDVIETINIELEPKVNSRAKVRSPKTRNNNKLVEPKSHTQKPGRQIVIGQRFSLNKSSAVHEKLNTPRSCLRWKPTGRIFNTTGLRWIPTGKMFTDNITKVVSEPPNGLNDYISNPYECDQTLNVSAGVVQEPVVSTGTPSSTRINQDIPSTSTSQTTQEKQSHVIPTSIEEDDHGIEVAHMDNDL